MKRIKNIESHCFVPCRSNREINGQSRLEAFSDGIIAVRRRIECADGAVARLHALRIELPVRGHLLEQAPIWK